MEENRVSVLNRVFSRNTFRHLIEESKDKTYATAVKRYVQMPEDKNNFELISEIYSELSSNYRNEYFYKNTLLNKLLIGIHSVNTTTALTEVPVAKSKADFLLINGKAVVYEIKTELDNFERLESQITDYYKAFNHVAVVTCEGNVKALEKKLESINKQVGIYVLKKNGAIRTVQKPQRYDESLDGEIIFKILRKSEYEEVLKERYKALPNVTQFQYYSECKKMFLQIPLEEAYLMALRQLKKRTKIDKIQFDKVPYELKFLVYFMNLKDNEYDKLEQFLYKQFGGV